MNKKYLTSMICLIITLSIILVLPLEKSNLIIHDPLHYTSFTGYDTSNNHGGITWTYDTNDEIWFSSPAISKNGTIYFGTTGKYLYAINPDGSLKWSYNVGSEITSTPVLDSNGIIYIGCGDWALSSKKGNGKLIAINKNGDELWSYNNNDDVFSSPAIDKNSTVYTISNSGNLYSIDENGTEKWSFFAGASILSPPIVDNNGIIYVSSEDYGLYAINSDGTERWRFETGDSIYSSPAITNNGSIFIGTSDGTLYSIDRYGKEKWSIPLDGELYSSPSIGPDGYIYITCKNGNIYSLNTNGAIIWKNTLEMSSIGDHSFTIDSNGFLYTSASNGKVYSFYSDGTIRWTSETGRWALKHPQTLALTKPVIGPDGTIYTLSRNGILYAISGEKNLLQQSGKEIAFISSVLILVLSIAIVTFKLKDKSENRLDVQIKKTVPLIFSTIFIFIGFFLTYFLFNFLQYFIFMYVLETILWIIMLFTISLFIFLSFKLKEIWTWKIITILSIIALSTGVIFLIISSYPVSFFVIIPNLFLISYIYNKRDKILKRDNH